jgi:nicotinamidase/pyrazinamidase
MACHYKPYHLHYEKKILDDRNKSNNSNKSNDKESKSALIIVNVQKAFLPGGSMGVLNGKSDAKNQSLMMINNINALIDSGRFDYHIYVQDAHPHDHTSFASSREGAKPFQVVDIEKNGATIQQILWPDHCRIDGRDYAPKSIAGTVDHLCKEGSGIQFATELRVPAMFYKNGESEKTELDAKSFVVNIGEDKDIDSFSAFKNYIGGETGLASSLISKGVSTLYVVGLTRDFAAWWTALDATTYVDQIQSPIFDVKYVWDATLPAPGSNKLLEYEYDGDLDSIHHKRFRTAIQSNEYGIREVMRGLVNPDPFGNRWVQTYLEPYGVDVVKTADLLSIPVDATFESMEDMGLNERSIDKNIERIQTSQPRADNTNLNFLKELMVQDSTVREFSTTRSDDTNI